MIVGLSGFKGCGKDTFADNLVNNYKYTKISMADKLKDACAVIFGWNRDMLSGFTKESRDWREQVDVYWAKKLNNPNFTPRLALQLMGTEAGRKIFGEDVWVAGVEKHILDNPGNYVIPDIRFVNEISMVKRLNGKLVLIHRGPLPNWYNIAAEWNNSYSKNDNNIPDVLKDIHSSEREWIGSRFDIEISNNSTINEMCITGEKLLGIS